MATISDLRRTHLCIHRLALYLAARADTAPLGTYGPPPLLVRADPARKALHPCLGRAPGMLGNEPVPYAHFLREVRYGCSLLAFSPTPTLSARSAAAPSRARLPIVVLGPRSLRHLSNL
jgi:hypothetical protein